MIALIVSPSLTKDGRKAAGLFDAFHDGRCIVERSTTPFCQGARVLLAEGTDPSTPIVMRHGYDGCDALRSTIGAAAGLSVAEGDRLPRFVPWMPYSPATGAPPMRPDGEAALDQPSPSNPIGRL